MHRIIINTIFLASERIGGSWSYTYNLLRALEHGSNEIEFVVLVNQKISPLLASLDMEKKVVPIDPESRILRVGLEQMSLPGILKRLSPAILHATGNVLPPRLPCKSVVTVHDFQYWYYPSNIALPRRMYLRYAVPDSLRRATRVICVSQATRNDAVKLYGVPSEKLAVIYEAGLWDGELATASREEDVRSRFSTQGRFLLSAGTSHPHKNLPRLIQAFGMIAREIPHDLLIVGEPFRFRGPLHEAVTMLPSELKDRVKLNGFIPRSDLLALYRAADAFIFPSLFEGFGIPALEAMGCGCPVVASRSSSLPEVIGDAGEYFDPLNVEDMARTVRKVCCDTEVRDHLRSRGFARAREFAWEKMGRETLEVYRSLLDDRNETAY